MEFDLKFNLATLEIGSWISTFLFGIVTSQVYSYFSHFPKDKRYIKMMVAIVWLCELTHTCSTASGFFSISIVHFNQPSKIFAKSAVGYTISTFMSAVIASLVQIYFAHRVLKVTGKRYVAYACWFLSFLRFSGSVGMTVMLATKNLADFQQSWLAAVTWSTGAVVDIVVAVTLTMYYVQRRREAIKLKGALDHLIPMTMQTGLLTSVSTVAVAICFIARPDTILWGAVGSALAKIFSISLLASLNARSFLREIVDGSDACLQPSGRALKFRTLPFSSTIDTGVLETRDIGGTIYYSFPGESTDQTASDEGYYPHLDTKKQSDPPTLFPFPQKTLNIRHIENPDNPMYF